MAGIVKSIRVFGSCCALLLLPACALQNSASAPAQAVRCVDPRPQICTMDYTPVCATRDSGRRCGATPCETTATTTYANGCGACADPRVSYYVPGVCGG
ncbi:MAG: hypothetical protein OEN02_04790 [Gammaproteobacteria bacterium]|nr:hypothetical protein [Gammaproteobacteria bacterium]MDH3534409.1 hypothetical protein [Gammaproteobacteria bacterium]